MPRPSLSAGGRMGAPRAREAAQPARRSSIYLRRCSSRSPDGNFPCPAPRGGPCAAAGPSAKPAVPAEAPRG